MKTKLSLFKYAIIFLTLVFLVACGTFEIGLEPDAGSSITQTTPDQTVSIPTTQTTSTDATNQETAVPTPEPMVISPNTVLDFINYVHPRWGYQIAVPNGAQADQADDGWTTVFTFTDQDRIFILEVEYFPEIPELVKDSVMDFIYWATGITDVPAVPVSTDGGDLNGASIFAPAGGGKWCEELRVQYTAFIADNQGYLINIHSDASGLCDAETIPETAAIVNSFQASPSITDTLEDPTTFPNPQPGLLQVAYVKDNNLWIWDEDKGSVALTKNGGVEGVSLSDDGQQIVFRRGGNIWAVNSDGTDERQLTSEVDFEHITYGEDLDPYVISITPYHTAWQPASHMLYFNTSPQMEGPGLFLSDDLWVIDTDSGELDIILSPGEGGNFAFSPDGRQIAIITPEGIDIINADGTNRRTVFTYTPIITYSEFQYYAEPVWTADSTTLLVGIPPVDMRAGPDQFTSIWSIPANSNQTARLLGQITTTPGSHASLLFSPDFKQVAFLVGGSPLAGPDGEPPQVAIAQISTDGIGEITILPFKAEVLNNWSPNGNHFVFTPPFDGVTRRAIGSLENEPVIVGGDAATTIDISWIDESRYLYVFNDGGRGWAILIGQLNNDEFQMVDGVVGPPPAFDFIN